MIPGGYRFRVSTIHEYHQSWNISLGIFASPVRILKIGFFVCFVISCDGEAFCELFFNGMSDRHAEKICNDIVSLCTLGDRLILDILAYDVTLLQSSLF